MQHALLSYLEAFKGKDRLLNYAGDYQKGEEALPFKGLENIVLKNRRRFRQYSDSKLMGETEDEYGKNIEAVEKLKRALKLMDKVVYGLYGLTEEEKRAVRGEV